MIYSNVEANIKRDAIEDAPRRAEALDRVLVEAEAQDSKVRPEYVTHEIQYLERVVKAARNSTLKARVRGLRARVDLLPEPDAGRRGGEVELSVVAEKENYGVSDAGGNKAPVIALASFLLPEMRGEALAAGDEVRASCVEGKLPEQLGKFTSFALPGKAACVIREWSEEDERCEAERARGAILQLRDGIAQMQELQLQVAGEIDAQGAAMADIAASAAEARTNVVAGTMALHGAREEQARSMPVGVGIAVGGVIAVASLASGAGAAGIVVKGVLTGAVSYMAAGQLSEWEMGVLRKMQEDLEKYLGNRCTRVLREEEELIELGHQAQQKFKELASCEWAMYRGPRNLAKRASGSLFAEFVQSKARPANGNCAFRVSFNIGLSAKDAWSIVDSLRVQGALDPDCFAWWTRPVQNRGEAHGVTSVRYAMYTTSMMSREFVSICRSSRVASEDDKEQYVLAVSSLDPETVERLEIVETESSGQFPRGSIYMCGMSFTATSDTTCIVKIIGDVDPKANAVVSSLSDFEDSHVRDSTLQTANKIMSTLQRVIQEGVDGGDDCPAAASLDAAQ